jgi:hypothetical protein
MENDKKNSWIADTIRSLDGMKRAEGSEKIYAGILHKMHGAKVIILSPDKPVSIKKLSVAAAVIFIIFSFNLYTVNHAGTKNPKQQSIDNVAQYYQLTDTNPLYNI